MLGAWGGRTPLEPSAWRQEVENNTHSYCFFTDSFVNAPTPVGPLEENLYRSVLHQDEAAGAALFLSQKPEQKEHVHDMQAVAEEGKFGKLCLKRISAANGCV